MCTTQLLIFLIILAGFIFVPYLIGKLFCITVNIYPTKVEIWLLGVIVPIAIAAIIALTVMIGIFIVKIISIIWHCCGSFC